MKHFVVSAICWCIVEMQPLTFLSSVQSLSPVQLFATPWLVAHQASLSITDTRSSPKLMSIESVMPSSHLILCRPLLLMPPIPPSLRVFSNKSAHHIRWPKYWSFSFNISHSNEHPGLISFRMDWLDYLQETVNKVKRQLSEWETIISNEATGQGLISKIYKQLI